MATTVPGVYRHGTIELLETPANVREGRVLVTLLEDEAEKPTKRPLQFGKYSVGRLSTEEDFKQAEWRGQNLAADE